MIRLRYERTKLESEMRSIINAFDDELEKMRLEKYRLEINMKCADLKTLVMYQVNHIIFEFSSIIISSTLTCDSCISIRVY